MITHTTTTTTITAGTRMAEVWSLLVEPFALGFMQRALAVALLLGVSGGLLGCVLMLRRMALMGDALAHSLLPGMAVAYLLVGTSPWGLLIGALGAGLLTGLGSGLISRLTRLKEDAAFGALFVLFFAVGIALISAGGVMRIDLAHFLFGNILGIGSLDLWLAAGVSSATVMAFAVFYRVLVIETLDPVYYRSTGRNGAWVHVGLMALVVTNLVAALQALGVVLSLGLFLLPATTAFLWTNRWGTMLAISVAVAVVGSVSGLLLSYHAGMPSGPAIIAVLGLGFLVSAVIGPHGGALAGIRQTTGR